MNRTPVAASRQSAAGCSSDELRRSIETPLRGKVVVLRRTRIRLAHSRAVPYLKKGSIPTLPAYIKARLLTLNYSAPMQNRCLSPRMRICP